MGLAKEAASSIDEALMGEAAAGGRRFQRLFRRFEYAMEVPREPSKARMNRSRRVAPADRRGNFVEISLGYTGEQARIEAERCLRCDVRERARRPLGEAEDGEGRAEPALAGKEADHER
jgi:NADH-quinone oxidoreductase subunit F